MTTRTSTTPTSTSTATNTAGGRNPFRFAGPITLDTLGDLFAHHGRLTGGWSMDGSDDDKGGVGGGGGGKDDDPDNKGGAGGGGGGGGGEGDQFTAITSQEEFDRRLAKRLDRERGKFADYDDLKKKAEAHDAAVEKAKTEHEKALEAARAEGKSEASAVANVKLVGAEARALAAELKFRNPATAVRLLDLSDVKVDDKGEPDRAAIKTKLDALITDEPYLIEDGSGGGTGRRKTNVKPDPTQGRGEDGNQGKGGGSVAQVMAERRAARAASKSTT